MSEFEDKLNSILSSPEAMGQIMALANSLGGGGDTAAPPQDSPSQPQPQPQSQPPAPQTPPPDLSALLSALGGGNAGNSNQSEGNSLASLGSIDPAMLSSLMTLMQEFSRNDDQKTALLLALKPFLREERWAKVDRAVQIARLSRGIRMALQMFGGGKTDV